MSDTALDPLTPAPTPPTPRDLAAAIDAIEAAVGGRQALIRAFELVDDPGLTEAINLIADPRLDARKLSVLCRRAGISIGELLEAYKRGVYAHMQLQVTTTIAEKTPAVVEDVLVRAAPHLVPCSLCHGQQQITLGADTAPCRCTTTDTPGQELVLPDLARQKLALDLANLLPKAGPLVAIQQNNTPPSAFDPSPRAFSQLQRRMDEATKATAPEIIEVDAVDTPVPGT